MRSQGNFWCPVCFCSRPFILAGYAQEAEKLPDLECWECGYVHTMATTEHPNGPPTHRHPITVEMRQAAKLQIRESFMRELRTNGHERELVTQGRLGRKKP